MAQKTAKRHRRVWLRNLLSGDHEAFAEFVEQYKEKVFLCCRTLGLKDDEVEDVASETFLAAYKGIKGYRGQAELGTWLWRITYCQVVNYLRKNQRKHQLLIEPDEQLTDDRAGQISAGLENEEQAEFVWRAVEQLPRLWAVAVVLFYREEKSVSEIAKIMKKRKNTVKTYLFRGRERLKEIIGPTLGDYTDGGK
ncbi:MAG: RNA polymerase sigma factor [Planctomycetota bacterium]